jgi:hypothetical protein
MNNPLYPPYLKGDVEGEDPYYKIIRGILKGRGSFGI